MIAALGCIGEFPQLVKNMFITETKNDKKIHGVKFYVRGKPWAVTVDEKMLFAYPSAPTMIFARPSADRLDNLWAAIIEKAWAKVKGNYLIADGGLTENGIRALTGIPVTTYATSDFADQAAADYAWDLIMAADAANFLMGARTAGNGND